jgi:hypothetical protein
VEIKVTKFFEGKTAGRLGSRCSVYGREGGPCGGRMQYAPTEYGCHFYGAEVTSVLWSFGDRSLCLLSCVNTPPKSFARCLKLSFGQSSRGESAVKKLFCVLRLFFVKLPQNAISLKTLSPIPPRISQFQSLLRAPRLWPWSSFTKNKLQSGRKGSARGKDGAPRP